MTMLGHVSSFIKLLKEEMYCQVDGLLQRFLICAPIPCFEITSEEMRTMPDPDISITCLLYAVHVIFNEPIDFRYDDDALKIYDASVDSFRKIVFKAHNNDVFIG